MTKMKKIITFSFVFLFAAQISLMAGGHEKYNSAIAQFDANNSSLYPINTNPVPIPFHTIQYEQAFLTDSILVGPEIPTDISGYDDYKTNGEVNHFIQVDPGNPNNLHAIDVQTPQTDPPGATTRQVKYSISTDGGATWTFATNVPSDGRRAGFPVLDLLNGEAVIANHNIFPGSVLDAILYVDQAPQAGSFTEYQNASHAPFGIWPQVATLSNGNIVMLSRRNIVTGAQNNYETLYVNLWNGTSLQPRSPFFITNNVYNGTVGSNMQYQIATNHAGMVVGLAYPVLEIDALGAANVFARTSTDNGATWGALTTVYTPHMVGSDPYGLAGGIDLVFKPNSNSWYMSYVETKDSAASLFYENSVLKVYKSDGTTSTLTDVAGVGATTSFAQTMSFVWNIDNPALGWSRDGRLMYCVYTVVKADLGTSGYNERDLYFQYSSDDAVTWSQPVRLTNTTDIDEAYPSISIYNKGNVTTNETYELNMTYMKDPGVGPTTFGGSAPASLNNLVYRKISFAGPIGIRNIGSDVPKTFSLNQNYPNPFNPTTKIRFAVPKTANVTLQVYDITGKVVATLINNVTVTAGNKEIDYNASNLASGIYFYRINAGTFTDTKKMILVK
jgi:hypothetical protein